MGAGGSEEARALDKARSLGKPVRVDSLTDETTEVWARPEGDFRADLSVGAVRVRRGSQWIPADLTLRPGAGGVEPVAHPRGLTLSGAQTGGTHELAAVGSGDNRVAMLWTGRLPSPILDGPRAVYADVLGGVDLVVQTTRDGFAQSLVLKSRAAVDQVGSVRLPLTGPGAARYVRDPRGAVTLSSREGRRTATVAQPVMWDATRDATDAPARTKVIKTAVERTKDGLAFTLTPDRSWLRDPKTVFPVTLDPTVTPISDTFDTFVREGATATNDTTNDLQVGMLSNGKKTRSFLTWNTSVLAGKQVTAATVKFFNFWSNVCAAKSWEIWPTDPASPTTVWSNQPALVGTSPSATSTQTQGGPSPCTDQLVSIDGRNFFQHFATASSSRAYMGVRATSETDGDAFKQFRSRDGAAADEVPTASVTYNAYPMVTARATVPASACATGAERPLVNTLTPQLKATVADADNTMSVAFEWWSVDGNTKIGGQTLTGVASGATSSVTVPAGAFLDGGRYKWRVQASDGVAGSSTWSSFCEMTTWVTVPPVTGCTGGVANDYNGDGVVDVAVGDPGATVGALADAGTVTIAYGSTGEVQTLQEGTNGVPDTPEAGDQFGYALATYDANRDGCSDLAVGAPFEGVGTAAEAGGVVLLLGSPAGLSRGPAGFWYDQGVAGWGDDVEAGDWFGYALAAGSTAAGEPFLAVGAPGEDVGTGVDAGIVHYRRGTTNVTMWAGAGAPGDAGNDDRLGYALAATPHHLAVSAPGEAVGATTWAGSVITYTHELAGGSLKPVGVIGDNASLIGDPIAQDDNFGKAIAMAPAAEPGVSILAVGAPGNDVGDAADAGTVFRFAVTPTAWTAIGSVVAPAGAAGDYFGEQVRISDGTDPTIAAGAPGADVAGDADAGRVFAFPATPATVTPVEVGHGSAPRGFAGAYLGSSGTYLYVSDPDAGKVTAYPWGSATPEGTWTAGTNAGAFGTAVS